ncbi:Inositol hexakisphosphate kinase 3 [Astathelohania contejeani]|uniref:Kinase n=1 Tax=Astathelohania contejeani TaxID=164912 RepID=A0ABQ7I1T6_9MICR|nr:Inositol hexakisphosphate kinase 3 [Thelohania contejeani]
MNNNNNLSPFAYQIGGSKQIYKYGNDKVAKPYNEIEEYFYKYFSKITILSQFIIPFYGTIRVDTSDGTQLDYIILEDLTSKFSKPCILDLKMGTRQYGINCSIEKRERKIKRCKETTSEKLGVRLCGLYVYKGADYIANNIGVDNISPHKIWNVKKEKEWYFKNKYECRKIKLDEFRDNLIDYLSGNKRLRVELIDPLLILLKELRQAISMLNNIRLYGSSLLIIYEGEGDAYIQNRNVIVKIIDFTNCLDDKLYNNNEIKENMTKDDKGYIMGLNTLIKEFENIKFNKLNKSNI